MFYIKITKITPLIEEVRATVLQAEGLHKENIAIGYFCSHTRLCFDHNGFKRRTFKLSWCGLSDTIMSTGHFRTAF